MTTGESLDEVKELVVKLAAITSHIDQRNREALQRVERGVASLDGAALRLQGGANEFARAVMQAVGQQVQSVVTQGSAHALDGFNTQLQASTGRVQWATEAMAEQRKLLHATQRALVWKGLIALLLGSVLAASAAGWLFWQARLAGGDAALNADIRQALQTGALTRCNGDELCARTASVPRGGKHAQNTYVIVH